MIEDERDERLRRDAPRFDVSPVRRGRGIPLLLGVGLIVGIAGFVGGLAIASPGPSSIARSPAAQTAIPSSTPAVAVVLAQPTIQPNSTFPPAAVRPSPTAQPGSSSFIEGFHPGIIVASLPLGDRCTGGEPLDNDVPRSRADGPRLTFQRAWTLYCRIPEAGRQSLLVDLFAALEDLIPADTYGYRSTMSGAGSALYPYAEGPMAGTVAVHADAAGDGLAIAVVVEEWRIDEGSVPGE